MTGVRMLYYLAGAAVVALGVFFVSQSATASLSGWGSSQYYGLACIETECGEPAIGSTVVAMVNGIECGSDVTDVPFADGEPQSTYGLDVLSDSEKPGCAQPGDTVHFFINGEAANPTVTWETGQHHVDIHTGPPFATFGGGLTCDGEPCIEFIIGPNTAPRVDAYIDGQVCASHAVSGWLITSWYSVNIPSAEAEPGCGTEGAVVTFTVDGAPANEVGAWAAGSTRLPLTTGQLVWGDVDCSRDVDPSDVLDVLRYRAGLYPKLTRCRDYGALVNVDGQHLPWGNFDCLGGINALDALKLLMAHSGVPVESSLDCPALE